MRHVGLGEYLVGVAGVGLMRHLFAGEDDAAAARIEEIRGIVCSGADVYDLAVDVPQLDPLSGYARWAETYDDPGNALISVEQPVVWAILDELPPGDALDAACGTGRHARHLVDLGHRVTAIDASHEMLSKAEHLVPEADVRPADVTSIPLAPGSVDVAVCALALEHVSPLDAAIGELARVVRPGGRIVLSDLHPIIRAVGGAAYFQDASGAAGIVRGQAYLHGDYLRAFGRFGLTVRQCAEPQFGLAEVGMQGPASSFLPNATEAAYLDMPAALIWDLVR